ncbi:3476_t:CDS:2, partial [Dentiscutata heterogama]
MGNDLSTSSKAKKYRVINNEDTDVNNVHEITGRKHTIASTKFPVADYNLNREYSHHDFFLKVWGSNYFSPIESILERGEVKVLDVGCGFGSWICDMAKIYPLSHFTGTDTIDPKDLTLSNVSFTQGDALEGLQYPDCSFDYIHFRDLLWHITSKDASNKLFPDAGPNTKFLMDALFNHIRNNGICPEEFYKNTTKLFKDNNLEYKVEERIIYFSNSDSV